MSKKITRREFLSIGGSLALLPWMIACTNAAATLAPPTPNVSTNGDFNNSLSDMVGHRINASFVGMSPQQIESVRSASTQPLQFLQDMQKRAGVNVWNTEILDVRVGLLAGKGSARTTILDKNNFILDLSVDQVNNPNTLVNEYMNLLDGPQINGQGDDYLFDSFSTVAEMAYEDEYGTSKKPTKHEEVAKNLSIILFPNQDYGLLSSGYHEWQRRYPVSKVLPIVLESLNVVGAHSILDHFSGSATEGMIAMLQLIAHPDQIDPRLNATFKDLQDRKIWRHGYQNPAKPTEILFGRRDVFTNPDGPYFIHRILINPDGSANTDPFRFSFGPLIVDGKRGMMPGIQDQQQNPGEPFRIIRMDNNDFFAHAEGGKLYISTENQQHILIPPEP